MTRFRLPLIALASLISTNAWADLKTFDVDPQYRQEIYAALQRILTPGGFPTQGRVELLPSGQLLVNASPETLVQVEQVLQTIRNRPAAAATPRADLSYWAVLGSRSGRRRSARHGAAELRWAQSSKSSSVYTATFSSA